MAASILRSTAKDESEIGFRPFTRADIPFGMKLKDLAGWNQIEADWARFLALAPEGCFVALLDGEPAGTATAVSYGQRLGWVGMVLVAPAKRRRGVGTALLNHAISYLENKGVETVKLDATPIGKLVYDLIGFVREHDLERWQGVGVPMSPEGRRPGAASAAEGVQPLTPDRLDDVVDFDTPIFGADRGRLLCALIAEGPTSAEMVLDEEGGVAGYAVTRPGRNAHQIGPWAADGPETAEALLRSALNRLAGAPVFVDVPLPNPHVLGMVKRYGFRRQRPFIRMHRGPNNYPGRRERIFGIFSPAKG